MNNPFTDYMQDLYWMYISVGYSEISALQLAEEVTTQLAKSSWLQPAEEDVKRIEYTIDMMYN